MTLALQKKQSTKPLARVTLFIFAKTLYGQRRHREIFGQIVS